MKFTEETRNRNHDGVPPEKRVFIYDATVIIDFLDKTFMPLHYYLSIQGINELNNDLQPKHFRDPKDIEKKMTMGELYNIYKMFRQNMSYTTEIESQYKFSVIVKKLRFRPNRWQFRVRRSGRAQFVTLAPLELRVKVDPEIRKKFPPGELNLSANQVPLTPEDHDDNIPTEPDTNDPTRFPADGYDTIGY